MGDIPVQSSAPTTGRFEIVVGVVAHSLPFAGSVLVSIPGRNGERVALVGSVLGHVGHGAKETFGIVQGANVALLCSTDSDEAYVLRVLPKIVTDSGKAPLDFMLEAGGSTAYTEALLYKLIFAPGQPFLFAHGGTPVDLQVGEWSMLNDFGGGFGLERFAAWLRASDFCGVFADGLTDTMRVVARSLAEQTATRADFDTLGGQGPVRVSTRALFRAEAYGMQGDNTTPDPTAAFVETGADPTGVSPTTGELAALDVHRVGDKEARLAARLVDAEGAVIGGAHRCVVLPKFTPDGDASYHVGESTALLREFRGLDGVYSLESRRGIHLWKTAIIADAVVTSAEPADGGVRESAYAADPFVLDAAAFGDFGLAVLAYEYHAFLAGLGAGTTGVPAVVDAAPAPRTEQQWQPIAGEDTSDDLAVLPFAAPVKYYRTSAGIDIMPDGSVVITDAWGSQIIMSGGNIVQTCPGDIYRTPGRNDVTLATGDIISRAKHDIDVSSSTGSVRVKAEVNVGVLAGNSGQGGVLIESRGTNAVMTMVAGQKAVYGGIALKSATDVVETADGGIERKAGQISDRAEMMTTSATNYDLSTQEFVLGAGASLYLFSESMMSIPADVLMQGNVHVKGRSRFGGWLYVEKEGVFSVADIMTKGILAANGVAYVKSLVQHGQVEADKLPVKDPFDQLVKTDKSFKSNTVRTTVDAQEQKALDAVTKLDTAVWAAYDKGIGARYTDAVYTALGFSFRFDLEYLGRTAGVGFTLPAAEWQQRMYAKGTGKGWLEPVVRFGEDYTAPYPGYEAWTGVGNDAEKHGLVLVKDPVYHDAATQAYADASAPATFQTLSVIFAQYPTPTR